MSSVHRSLIIEREVDSKINIISVKSRAIFPIQKLNGTLSLSYANEYVEGT